MGLICKGRARCDGGQLALYLMDLIGRPKNERTELIETRGYFGRDLRAMFRIGEDAALADHPQAKALFHGQLRTEDSEVLTREQAIVAADIMERHLGFERLDRAIVSHVFHGHEHFHVVWNRHDRETGELRSIGFHANKRLAAAEEIERRFELRQLDRSRTNGNDGLTHAESQQNERSTHTKAERVAILTGLWRSTDSGKAFQAALEASGEYTLAIGKRGFVIMDAAGEVHSLARQIEGMKTAEVRERLADLDQAQLPEVDALRADLAQARQDRAREARQQQATIEAGNRPKSVLDPTSADPVAFHAVDSNAAPASPEPLSKAAGNTAGASEAERHAPMDAAAILEALTRNHSTFSRADLARLVDRETGGGGHQTWMVQEGGFEALDDEHKRSAERSYATWSIGNPTAAARYDVSEYVAYVQKMQIGRQGDAVEARQIRIDTKAAFDKLMAEVDASADLIRLPVDRQGRERFTSRAMLETELTMQITGDTLAGKRGHAIKDTMRDTALETAEAAGRVLGKEQRAAFTHITGAEDLSMVVGFAGTGKSTMLEAARMAWEAAGYRVRGAAISGIAAEGLHKDAGIHSRTLSSLLHQIDGIEDYENKLTVMDRRIADIGGTTQKAQRYRASLVAQRKELKADLDMARLSDRDVLVIDEAGMVDSRKMEHLLSVAAKAGAKVVLVGDAEQLQSIEAGAAFRALKDRHGAAEITEIRRQHDQWQRVATHEFATGRTVEALDRYRAHGQAHEAGTRDQAKAALIQSWTKDRADEPEKSRIILAYTRADVADLNHQARADYRAEGRLGDDHQVKTASGPQEFAAGDRLYFTRNDTRLGVKNGTLGTIQDIEDRRITVRTDTGKTVQFDTHDYDHIAHGYAATVHKSQGVTVDRAYVMASRYMDRHAAYVGMTRHRDSAELHYAVEEFKDFDRLARRMSRDGGKDTTLDYVQRAENGERTTSSLRDAVSGFWQRLKGLFQRPAWLDVADAVTPEIERGKDREKERGTSGSSATADRNPAAAKDRGRTYDDDDNRASDDRPSEILLSLLAHMTAEERAAYGAVQAEQRAADRLRRELERKSGRDGPYHGR